MRKAYATFSLLRPGRPSRSASSRCRRPHGLTGRPSCGASALSWQLHSRHQPQACGFYSSVCLSASAVKPSPLFNQLLCCNVETGIGVPGQVEG